MIDAVGPISVLTALMTGGCAGSFINTTVVRSLRGEALHGRSHCDGCYRTLSFQETLPLLSYAAVRGRCRLCTAPIDRLQLTAEAGGAAVVAATFLIPAPDLQAWLVRGVCAILGLILLAIGLYDQRTLLIPDGLTAGVLVCSVLLACMAPTGIWVGLIAGVACLLTLELMRRAFLRLRREPGLGFGDVKLLSALAVWLGPQTPWAVVVACVLALASRVASRSFLGRAPFGPWIAAGAWGVGLWWEAFPWA